MNLFTKLEARADNPIRVAMIGAGKFGAMFLAQAPRTPGIHVVAIAELNPDRARQSLATVGWEAERYQAGSLDDARKSGGLWITEDAHGLIASDAVDLVIDLTGNPVAGVGHALACAEHGKHAVMVNVEADVLAGPAMAKAVQGAGKVYSMAYGDQPALISEQVDWARAAGFTVVAAGKGTRYRPEFHASTPDTVWGYYGLTAEQAAASGMNAKMFNSFLDGTKSAIEMAAVANATGLTPAPGGLTFQPCGVHDLPAMMRPRAEGGCLHHKGQVEVISSDEFDGRKVVGDLRWGTYVAVEAHNDYVGQCFSDYGMPRDPSGRYSALWRPYHYIGLELGITIASIATRGEATGAPTGWRGDAVAVAKRDLAPGDMLDGEGGTTVWGRLYPADRALAIGGLPIGLAQGAKMIHPVMTGQPVRYADVAIDENDLAVKVRREMEVDFAPALPAEAAE